MKAEGAYISVSALMEASASGKSLTQNLRDQISRLDSRLLSLASECGLRMDLAVNTTAEDRASRGLGLVASYVRTLLSSAEIDLEADLIASPLSPHQTSPLQGVLRCSNFP